MPATSMPPKQAIATAPCRADAAADTRTALLFERERMRRILLDFTLTADEVKARVRKQIPDLADAEFARWDAAGLFEHQSIDGRTLYFNRAPSNLFRLSAEALARSEGTGAVVGRPDGSAQRASRRVRDAALAHRHAAASRRDGSGSPSRSTVDADAVPAGETVRAWIPYPRALPGPAGRHPPASSSTPAKHVIAPESAMQRTVYLEKPREAGKPTEFSITYELTVFGQYHAIDPGQGRARSTLTPELAPYLAERPPHIVFTDDDARVLAQGGRRRDAIPTASRRSSSPPSTASRGPARASTRPSPTSATTRCMPAMPTAASRRCC